MNCFRAACALSLLLAGLLSAEPRKITSVVRADSRSGRLVRSIVMSPRHVALAPGAALTAFGQLIDETARRHDVDPLLVHSVVQVESNYDPFAISPKGAQGLMQLIPSTARRFGAIDSFNPKENLDAGVRYLKYLQDTFQDERLALAAYNAGEGAVLKYGNVPPYRETEDYVVRVGKRYGEARRKAAQQPAPAARLETPPAEPAVHGLETYTDPEGRLYLRTR